MKTTSIFILIMSVVCILTLTGQTTINGVPDQTVGPLNVQSGNFTVSNGDVTAGAASGNLNAGTGGFVTFNSRSTISSPADGRILFRNLAATGFTRMMFGATTSSFPALFVYGNALGFQQANSSNGVALSTLSACSSTGEGAMIAVNDASTTTWGATLTGSGSSHVLAYCNGTDWTVMAK